jgi:glycosyltransferase involved in cell wall biosynthesis
MPKISIATHFYNCPQRVREQIVYWESLPPAILSEFEFVVIDDCSQQSPLWSATKLDLKVFRITTDIPWNQSGARNLATFHARGDWVIYSDIDQRFNPGPMRSILDNLNAFDKMTMYYLRSDNQFDANIGQKLQCHPNTYLVNLEKFKMHGMFDEDFAGHYGYEDMYMPLVWERHGGKRVILNDANYFEDLSFSTAKLNRDLSRNKLLGEQKLSAGTKNSIGVLRFEWEQVRLDVP